MQKIEFRLEALLTLEMRDLELNAEEKEEIRKILEARLPNRFLLVTQDFPRLYASDVRLRILPSAES